MGQQLIDGVENHPLNVFENDSGKVLHFIKESSPYFSKFGEVYFSVTNPGIIKGWKFHKEMEQNFVVPSGSMKIVLFDEREGSATKGMVNEFTLGTESYSLLKIPPQVWYSFKCVSEAPAMIANCATITHDPDETKTADLGDSMFPYKW